MSISGSFRKFIADLQKRDDSGDSSDLSPLRKSTLRGEEKLKQHDWGVLFSQTNG